MRFCFRAGLFVMAALSMGASAQAGTIVAPIGATANVATRSGGYSLSHLFDQSGLSIGYTSGVSDFDNYIASEPKHNSLLIANGWATNNFITTGTVTLDLGVSISVESFVLWNRGVANQGMKDFRLRACPDSTCTTSTLLGSFTAANNIGTDGAVGAQVFAFSATTTQYLRVIVQNSYSGTALTAGEMAFEQSAMVTDTPEPASALLLAGGLLGLTARRRYGAG